jgi:NADH dehydrogenase
VTRRVVIVGGGYVTLHACIRLRRALRREIAAGAVELLVISADDAHNFHGFTGEVLAGMMPLRRTRTPLERVCRPATVIQARVTAVDRHNRVVTYLPVGATETRSSGYDELIVGTGGHEPVDAVPGLAEHGYTLRGPGELGRFVAVVERLSAAGGGRIVVAGGGLGGVELAAALADRGRGRIVVDLVHAGRQLLPALRADQPRLAERAERDLARLGVRVHPGLRLAGVTPTGAILSDGTVLPADAVLGVIGQRPVPISGLDADLLDSGGRLLTRPDLSVAEHVWAAGDAARVRHVRTRRPVPANALWAIKGGAHVGSNVARAIQGRPTRRFGYRGLGQAASFGLGRSVAELYGVPFTGALAWALRLVFFLRFMPSHRTAAAVLGDVGKVLGGMRFGPDGGWKRPAWGQRTSGSEAGDGRGSRRSDPIDAVSSSGSAPSPPRIVVAANAKSAESSGSRATPGTSPFSLVTHTPAAACHACATSITAVVAHRAT